MWDALCCGQLAKWRLVFLMQNAMIENLVVLTHVPRKKIVQWFDDRRLQNESKKSSFDAAPELWFNYWPERCTILHHLDATRFVTQIFCQKTEKTTFCSRPQHALLPLLKQVKVEKGFTFPGDGRVHTTICEHTCFRALCAGTCDLQAEKNDFLPGFHGMKRQHKESYVAFITQLSSLFPIP